MIWQDEYKRKVMEPREAVEYIQSNMRVYIHPGCAEPETLVEALIARAPFVKNVEIVHLLTTGRADYIAPQMEGHFRHNAMHWRKCPASGERGARGLHASVPEPGRRFA
jgi:4-hydroxybutyrate CoA-transferase